LYEGIAKLMNPQWSSSGFLKESRWILSGFADWIVSNPTILNTVDFLNTWGLIAIGLGLILGLFFKAAAITGSLLLVVYWLNCPPLVGLEYTLPADGNNLIIDKTLIEAITLMVLALFSTSTIVGLDAFIHPFRKKGEVVK
jgi:thiosulfate dehydrogenase [quinone] large subunit